MTKILFLDMDGVLNSMPSRSELYKYHDTLTEEQFDHKFYGIDPDLAKLLKLIIDRTQCKIVFSTSWRYFKDHCIEGSDWRQSLADVCGISTDIFIGNTPDVTECGGWESGSLQRRRGTEIKMWLEYHTDIAIPGSFRFCIIDDEVSDILPVIGEEHVVHTDMKTGLTIKDVDRAIRILNGD